MLTKTIKYIDYDGNEREEICYFNLSRAEVLELQFTEEGSLEEYITRIVKENNQKKIYELFKEIVTKSYGEKSSDGRRFIKSKEATEAFMQTEAFSELIMEFFKAPEDGKTNAPAEFIKAIIPKDLGV